MTSPSRSTVGIRDIADIADRLADLPGSRWTSLLLDIARRRAHARSPTDVLAQHKRDSFVAPAAIDQRALHWVDGHMLAVTADDVDAIELSPVVPLGTVSAVAKAHQNKICSAQRSLEVVADPTNALALIAAVRRRERTDSVRLFTSHRALRMQRFGGPLSWQHFRLACWVTAGRDSGGHRFELDAAREHVDRLLTILDRMRAAGLPIGDHQWTAHIDPAHARWAERVLGLPALRGANTVALAPGGYYRCLRVMLDVEIDDGTVNIADGGFVDWLERLCVSRRERLFISAIGTERLAAMYVGARNHPTGETGSH